MKEPGQYVFGGDFYLARKNAKKQIRTIYNLKSLEEKLVDDLEMFMDEKISEEELRKRLEKYANTVAITYGSLARVKDPIETDNNVQQYAENIGAAINKLQNYWDSKVRENLIFMDTMETTYNYYNRREPNSNDLELLLLDATSQDEIEDIDLNSLFLQAEQKVLSGKKIEGNLGLKIPKINTKDRYILDRLNRLKTRLDRVRNIRREPEIQQEVLVGSSNRRRQIEGVPNPSPPEEEKNVEGEGFKTTEETNKELEDQEYRMISPLEEPVPVPVRVPRDDEEEQKYYDFRNPHEN
jgi:hypothetical protein